MSNFKEVVDIDGLRVVVNLDAIEDIAELNPSKLEKFFSFWREVYNSRIYYKNDSPDRSFQMQYDELKKQLGL